VRNHIRTALPQPVLARSTEKLFKRNAVATDQNLPLGRERAIENVHSRQSFALATGFHFQRDHIAPAAEDKVHLRAAISPISDLDAGAHSAVEQMGADRGLDQPAPKFSSADEKFGRLSSDAAPSADDCCRKIRRFMVFSPFPILSTVLVLTPLLSTSRKKQLRVADFLTLDFRRLAYVQ